MSAGNTQRPPTTGSSLPAVLFVCTGNAGRSQMAEAVARQRLGDGARLI